MERIKRILKKLFLNFGIKAVSVREYKELRLQRNVAVKEVANTMRRMDLTCGLSLVVFSKDRSMQLDLLLESLDRAIDAKADIFILYKASSERHARSYKELAFLGEYDNLNISFIEELHGFKKELLGLLKRIRTEKLCFLTDDNVFIRKWSLSKVVDMDASENILSLRHGLNITYSYNENKSISQPRVTLVQEGNEIFEFDWSEGSGEWSDPMSVDGHVYLTADIFSVSLVSDFRAPNTYEAALKTYFDFFPKKGACYLDSVIVNLPINIVQNEVKNKSGNVSLDYLLGRWEEGFRISLSSFDNIRTQSTHKECEVKFVLR